MSTQDQVKPSAEALEIWSIIAPIIVRERRKARAEAYEHAGWACLAMSEGGDQAVQCAKRMAELAAKERAQ